MKVVHIGIGKCATTTLQKYIFPRLAEMIKINYLSKIGICLEECYHLSLTEYRKNIIKKIISINENVFISCEGLVGPNHYFWEIQADENVELFGRETHIIITLREPVQLMQSLYQQNVQMGSVIKPENFFLNDSEYKSIQKIHCESYLRYFNVDTFDFEKLYQIYKKRFSNVTIVPMETIKEMKFLEDIFSLNKTQVKELKDSFQRAPILNKSYSKLGMELTFFREKLLLFFGIRSIYKTEMMSEIWLENKDNSDIFDKYINPVKLKISFIKRLFNKIKRFLSWRFIIQKFLDKLPFVLNEKYQLPKSIYLNYDLIKKNRKFLSKFL